MITLSIQTIYSTQYKNINKSNLQYLLNKAFFSFHFLGYLTIPPNPMNNSDMIKEFYRKTKLIHKNQVKTIWQATHIYTGDVVIAKIQTLNDTSNQRNLLHEGKFLQSCQGSPGIPFLLWCGKDQVHRQALLIQQKLGKTLKHVISESPANSLSLKSVIMIGIQLIKVIACYHEKGYIHRNINLDTIQFGVGSKCDKVYFNDFIQSRSFYKKGTLQHIDHKIGIKIKKATQFTSYDVLKGNQPARKDDIESIILVLIYLLKNKLPWTDVWNDPQSSVKINENKNSQKGRFQYSEKQQFIKLKSQQKINNLNYQVDNFSKEQQKYLQNLKKIDPFGCFNKSIQKNLKNNKNGSFLTVSYEQLLNDHDRDLLIQLLGQDYLKNAKLQKKIESTVKIMGLFSTNQLCHALPQQINEILADIRGLEFNSKPNYLLYVQKLNGVLIKNGLQNDNRFDWMNHKSISQSSIKGGLSIKHFEWLMKGENNKSKLIQFENEPEILALYDKMAPFIQIDKLVTL